MTQEITSGRRAFAAVFALALVGFAIYLLVQDSVVIAPRRGREPTVFSGTSQLVLCLSVLVGAFGVWRLTSDRTPVRATVILLSGCALFALALVLT